MPPRRALLGNWFEEEAYERDRKLLMQGRNGGLVDASSEVANVLAKVKHHNTPYNIAPIHKDGFLRFYSPVMLQNACTLGYLALDLDDRARTAKGWEISCSTSSATEATLRSSFVLVPAPMPPTDSFPIPPDEEDMVHYGQPFYIMTVDELCDDPLSLMSEFKTPSSASKVTGKYQNVYFSPDGGSAAAMWCVDFADPEYQEDVRDHPVKATDMFILRHNMSNCPMASIKETYFNDFGPQYEVNCHRFTAYASKRKAGPMADENYWMFIHQGQGSALEEELSETMADSKRSA